MEKNSIKQLLMTSNFYVLNKQLVKSLGIETAFFLTALVEADEMLSDENGWFYQTVPQIEEITGLTKHKQNNSINELIALGILLQENKGMPMKRYFKLDYKKISDILFSSSQKNVHQGSKKLATKEEKNLPPREQKIVHHGGEKLATNKELNINNLDKKLNNKQSSSSVDKSTQPQPHDLEKKSIEFKNNISELRDIIINSTGENPQTVDMVFKPVMYREIIKPLLVKIKSSKFLMGEKETKPKLYTFVRQDRVNEILAGLYDDFKTEKTKYKGAEIITVENLEEKARREKEQEEFDRMLGL